MNNHSEESFESVRLRAEQGDADAQYNLGVMYANGEGVPQDDEEAARWWLLGADQGLVNAQYRLGFAYETGQGVPQDDKEADLLGESEQATDSKQTKQGIRVGLGEAGEFFQSFRGVGGVLGDFQRGDGMN